MTGSASIRRWHAAAPDRIRVEPLDALTLLYDRASGQTHLLAEPLPHILVALATQPMTVAELADHLAQAFDLAAEGDATIILTERLDELAVMGLVEPR